VRGIEADVLPVCQQYGMGVIPWSPLSGGWLTGRYRHGQDLPATGRAALMPQRFDPANPDNRRKLDLVEELLKVASDAGTSLVHLALAFVIQHPAVTAAIVGPRTMEQMVDQLPAADLVLEQSVFDRIDEIVPPGTNVDAADAGWVPPALAEVARRRRGQ